MLDEHGVDEDPRMPRVRAHVLKLAEASPITTAAIQNIDDDHQFWENQGAIQPPYDPKAMVVLFEHSNALRQNVDAYSVNIDGFGHSFKAVVDLEADSTVAEVRTLIALERQVKAGKEDVPEPTDDEVLERIKQLANEQRRETFRLNMFFSDCADISFVDLRRRTRTDIEITGNGYWEVLRDAKGRIAQFVYVECFTVRLTQLDAEFTEYDHKRRTMTYDFETVKRRKRFRRFIQKFGSAAVYFKEFGDPRIISARTGKPYRDEAELREKEPGVSPATEMIHFKIPSPRTAYGIPRWMGNLLSVMGSRQSEEVNFNYFENKSVPPLAILVSGGRLTADSVKKIEGFIENEIRGKHNFHKILVIEAESAEANEFENSGRMTIEIKPLTEAQNSDALFQQYDERNIDKVGMSFRVPRMLRGDTRDFNRSTAAAALDFAERQVFEPERMSFDYLINRRVLPDIGIKHWELKSNSPTQRDPESLAKMIHDLQDFMTPNILMELAQGCFNRNFPRINEPWADMPLKLVLATANMAEGGLEVPASTPEAEDADPDNQAPGNEPESSTLETSDNKGQDRAPDGKFGGPGGKKKPKARVQPARKAVDSVRDLAGQIVDIRMRLASALTSAGVDRADQKRRADNDTTSREALCKYQSDDADDDTGT